MEIIKKIYTILVLIKNLLIRKKYYKLHFVAENDPPIKLWYYDFPHWGFDKHNLLMVSGADTLCELYAKGQNHLTVEIIATNKELQQYENDNYDKFIGKPFEPNTKLKDKIMWGRDYTNIKTIMQNLKEQTVIRTMWICPVTLFVLGRYPNVIYIKNKK